MTVLQNPKLANLIPLQDIFSVFSLLNIYEFKPQKIEHMNYEILDMQSIRIIKRFLQFLSQQSKMYGGQGLDFNQFMQELITKQIVKTKSSNAEVFLFSSQKFFKKLAKHGIKKSSR